MAHQDQAARKRAAKKMRQKMKRGIPRLTFVPPPFVPSGSSSSSPSSQKAKASQHEQAVLCERAQPATQRKRNKSNSSINYSDSYKMSVVFGEKSPSSSSQEALETLSFSLRGDNNRTKADASNHQEQQPEFSQNDTVKREEEMDTAEQRQQPELPKSDMSDKAKREMDANEPSQGPHKVARKDQMATVRSPCQPVENKKKEEGHKEVSEYPHEDNVQSNVVTQNAKEQRDNDKEDDAQEKVSGSSRVDKSQPDAVTEMDTKKANEPLDKDKNKDGEGVFDSPPAEDIQPEAIPGSTANSRGGGGDDLFMSPPEEYVQREVVAETKKDERDPLLEKLVVGQQPRTIPLQAKAQEYFLHRELLMMNDETPQRRDETPPEGMAMLDVPDEICLKDEDNDKVEDAVEPKANMQVSPEAKPAAEPVVSPASSTAIKPSSQPTLDAPKDNNTRKEKDQRPFRFYFVEKGCDMHAGVLEKPKILARTRGAEVDDHFSHSDPPTHLVVSSHRDFCVEALVEPLGFESVDDLRDFVHKHGIVCVRKKWAATNRPKKSYHETPPLMARNELFMPLRCCGPSRKVTTKSSPEKRKKEEAPPRECEYNVGVSDLLRQLSKAYQEAPMDDTDPWRSYTFQNVAGRLRHLKYEVTLDNVEEQVKVKGIGNSTLDILREYLREVEEQGNCVDDGDEEGITVSRLKNLQENPERQAIRAMMQVWGIGKAKGRELVDAGYRDVGKVRDDFLGGRLTIPLYRNMAVGLVCFEDLLEKMAKQEVEAIAEIVKSEANSFFENAEIQILGSYRRKKGSRYGDVDVMITHPDYYDEVPKTGLGEIVQSLRRKGHIAYHLTNHPGMDDGEYDASLPRAVINQMASGTQEAKTRSGRAKCTSYMGIIKSPQNGRLRRVDIKFYPHRSRVFAALYFTGNGYFNRSMRLWSKRKFGWRLNDHGLYKYDTGNPGTPVMEAAANEREIFDALGLVYKEPHERDCFDAVIGKEGKSALDLEEFGQGEFRQEEYDHQWIY